LKPAVRPKPWTGEALLDRLLTVGGWSDAHLRKLIRRNYEALDAVLPEKRVHKLDHETGEMYVERTEGGAPDWDARLKAIHEGRDMVGLRAPRPQTTVGPINVAVLTWSRPSSSSPHPPKTDSFALSDGSTSGSVIEASASPIWGSTSSSAPPLNGRASD
jgi:hypothetical protein